MRICILATIAILPRAAFGCFGGEYYIYHQDGFAMLGIGLTGIAVAIFIRMTQGILSWYLPAGVFVVAAFFPAVQWWHRGSGDCGIGFYESSVLAAGIAYLYLLYELVRYWIARRKGLQRGAA